MATVVRQFSTPTAVTETGGAALCKWGGSRARAKMEQMVGPAEMNGALNPAWVEWLMGWPVGWTSMEPLSCPDFPDWSYDPGDTGELPRTAVGVPHRVGRLKALGNGQVPLCAAVAWTMLREMMVFRANGR